MPAIERYRTIEKMQAAIDKQSAVVENISRDRRKAMYQLSLLRHDLGQYKYDGWGNQKKEVRKFIRKCPVDNCNGFLSTQWKCGLCDTKVCSDCLEIKPESKTDEHVCNADSVASAKVIKRDTKPCPSCGVRIYKISGCDQMWCVECRVAFSWSTGCKIRGRIHNPHFYEYQQAQGENAVRNPGDIACCGIPNYYDFRDRINACS